MKENEYDPLFEPGFHDIEENQIYQIFVEPFNNSKRREFLAEHLRLLLDELKKIGVDFELWINGSFATKKPDPNDIDIAAFFSPDQFHT